MYLLVCLTQAIYGEESFTRLSDNSMRVRIDSDSGATDHQEGKYKDNTRNLLATYSQLFNDLMTRVLHRSLPDYRASDA